MLSACGGSSNNGDPSSDGDTQITGGSGVSSLAGTYAWDSSFDGDEGYIIIGSNGSLSAYDYAGDSYDDYGNCYWIEENYGSLTHISGTQYSESNIYEPETYLINIVSTSTGITVSGEDEFGPFETSLARTNLSASDFTPECAGFAKPVVLPSQKNRL